MATRFWYLKITLEFMQSYSIASRPSGRLRYTHLLSPLR